MNVPIPQRFVVYRHFNGKTAPFVIQAYLLDVTLLLPVPRMLFVGAHVVDPARPPRSTPGVLPLPLLFRYEGCEPLPVACIPDRTPLLPLPAVTAFCLMVPEPRVLALRLPTLLPYCYICKE